ncbi:HD domain-containing protein [Candidatus Babeliales bacterium]|nr:HD domain-containing protein [Candidatus Babeliales bacterium]
MNNRIKGRFLLISAATLVITWGMASHKKIMERCMSQVKNGQDTAQNQAFTPQDVQTPYGTFTVNEPVILEILESPVMQRIKKVNQFGVPQIVKGMKQYSRYDHCLGVWALLRRFGAGVEEQIAGLLHDASHTVFSHVADFMFNTEGSKDSYQDTIHEWYLTQGTIPAILAKHGMNLNDIMHKSGAHVALEQCLPDLCADRIEYNLREGVLLGIIDEHDVQVILNDLAFNDGHWFFNTPKIARLFSRIPLYLTQHSWGGPENFLINTWTVQALQRAMDIGLLTKDDFHFSTDDVVWDKLVHADDSVIKRAVRKIRTYKTSYEVSSKEDGYDYLISSKFRGVNPLVKDHDGFKRLTEIDKTYAHEYAQVRQVMAQGWAIKLVGYAAQGKHEDDEKHAA